MRQYLELLAEVLEQGADYRDRTGIGARSLFGRQLRFDLQEGFPLLTTKKLHVRSIIYELLWFLRGDTNVRYLQEHGVSIWNEWADENGELGPIYGYQWRHWGGDQLGRVVRQLREQPHSRRHIVSAWNAADLDQMRLPPCHLLFQFHVAGERLSCQMYQRSADLFLGVPFNIASYALLTMIIARLTDLQAGEFVHTFGDVHLYHNHFEQAKLQLQRSPGTLPTLRIAPGVQRLEDFDFEHFILEGYEPQAHIPAPVAV